MYWQTKLFGGVCKVTLGTSNATWDMNFAGPGVIKQSKDKLVICTEFGEAVYDKKCVVGYSVSYTKGGLYAPTDDEGPESGPENVEV
jgi:hypothetical protein